METVNLNLNRSEVGYDTINEGFEERGNNSSENSGDSLPSTTVSVSSPKRSRRAIQKRVVKVPIKDIEAAGGRFSKGDCTTPPSDSWAWRKYGQKPIKGSPYPRGYYRCSSSKGCPARKQVERNRLDPSMLLITYSYDHNHSFPISTRNHHHTTTTPPPKFTPILIHDKIKPTTTTTTNIITHEPNPNNFINHETTTTTISPTADVEFTWAALSSSSSTTTTSMYLTSTMNSDIYNYPMMGEEEESDLFADLGELPECSIVFGRKDAGYEEDDEIRRRRQCSSFSTTPWCGGTTSSTG